MSEGTRISRSSNNQPKKKSDGYRIFIGNIPTSANVDVVREEFLQFGNIISCHVMPGKLEGTKIGFIEFDSSESAQKATSSLATVNGTKLLVRPHISKDFPKKKYVGRSDFEHSEGKQSTSASLHNSDSQRIILDCIPSSYPKEKVYVSAIAPPISLWVQSISVDQGQQLQHIVTTLQECDTTPPASLPLQFLTKFYAARFSEDDQWYRCIIDAKVPNNVNDEYRVTFIDYGNTEERPISAIVELPSSLATLPPYAKKCSLFGLSPKFTHDIQKQEEVLKNSVLDKVVEAQFIPSHNGEFPLVVIIYQGECLNRFLVKENLADVKSVAEQEEDVKSHAGQEKPKAKVTTPLVKNKKKMVSEENHSGFNGSADQSLNVVAPKAENGASSSAHVQLKNVQSELEDAMRQQALLKSRAANAESKLEEMKALVTKKEEEAGRLKKSLQVLEKKGLNQRIEDLVSVVSQVKKLRLELHADNKEDVILSTILVCENPNKISLSEVASMHETDNILQKYRDLQNKMKECHTRQELTAFVDERKDLRKLLFQKIDLFLRESKALLLDERSAQIKGALANMHSVYDRFLVSREQCSPIDEGDLRSRYEAWKEAVVSESDVGEARTLSNTQHNAIHGSLTILNQKLALLRTTGRPERPVGKFNHKLDDLMTSFHDALAAEVNVTGLVTTAHFAFISSVCCTLVKKLEAESAAIMHLRSLCCDYATISTAIEPWLDGAPCLAQLEEARRSVKSYRSKIRHLRADIADQQDENNEKGLAELLSEAQKMCTCLQQAFESEKSCLLELMDLANNHFPELCFDYPELKNENYSFVRLSHQLEHYEPTSFKSGLMITTYLNQPVVLKELPIDSCDKNKMLQKAAQLKSLVHENLVTFDLVFFSKDSRLAFVQLRRLSMCLTEFVASEAGALLGHGRIAAIILMVVEGMNALHQKGLIHGSIHPNNVLLDDDGNVFLDCFAFNKSAHDRMMRNHVTASGLKFVSPEVRSGGQVTASVDIFHVGLLMVWLHAPRHKFVVDVNSVPVFNAVNLSADAFEAAKMCLQLVSSQRCLSESLLGTQYLKSAKAASQMTEEDMSVRLQLRRNLLISRQRPTAGAGILKKPSINSNDDAAASLSFNIFPADGPTALKNQVLDSAHAAGKTSDGDGDHTRSNFGIKRENFEASVDDVSNHVTNVQGDMTNVHGDMTNVHGDMTNVHGDTTNVHGDMTNVQDDMTNVQGDMTNVQGDMTNVQGDMTNVQGDMTNVQGDMTNVQDDTSGIQYDISGVEYDASDVQYDASGVKCDASGVKYDASDVQYDASGVEYDASDVRYDASGVEYDASGVEYDASGVEYDAGGVEYGASGVQYDASGVQYDASGVQYDASGVQYDASGVQYDASGVQYDASGVQDNTSGAQDNVKEADTTLTCIIDEHY